MSCTESLHYPRRHRVPFSLSTRLHLHILCNRNQRPAPNLWSRLLSFGSNWEIGWGRQGGGGGKGARREAEKLLFYSSPKCQRHAVWSLKNIFLLFSYFSQHNAPYLSGCNHFWKFRVCWLLCRVCNVYFSLSSTFYALNVASLCASAGARDEGDVKWMGEAFSASFDRSWLMLTPKVISFDDDRIKTRFDKLEKVFCSVKVFDVVSELKSSIFAPAPNQIAEPFQDSRFASATQPFLLWAAKVNLSEFSAVSGLKPSKAKKGFKSKSLFCVACGVRGAKQQLYELADGFG